MDPLEIDGQPPNLVGKICEALVCSEYWHEGNLFDPANTVFIRANGGSHKLFFDSGVIFWRPDVEPQPSFDAPEIASEYRLVDLGHRFGLVGRRITTCDAAATANGAKVTLEFEGGRSIVFETAKDVTSYVAA